MITMTEVLIVKFEGDEELDVAKKAAVMIAEMEITGEDPIHDITAREEFGEKVIEVMTNLDDDLADAIADEMVSANAQRIDIFFEQLVDLYREYEAVRYA